MSLRCLPVDKFVHIQQVSISQWTNVEGVEFALTDEKGLSWGLQNNDELRLLGLPSPPPWLVVVRA